MLVRIVPLALWAMLAGCTTAKETYLPDGSKGYSISCDGIASSMESCFLKAGEICGAKGYDMANPQGSYLAARTVFIRCKR